MTEQPMLTDPRELQDPLALKDPLILTPSEQREYTRISNHRDFSTLEKVGAVLGAAFLLHRAIISRRIKEKAGAEPRVSSLRLIADASAQILMPRWLSMVTPAILAGYRIGVKEAKAGNIPEKDLHEIAEAYARQLGGHYNEVSTDAMVQGFQAQVNRKVPAARAARMVAEAYGVPPRAMNALVSIWSSEDPKRFTSMPEDSVRDIRAKTFIDSHLRNRAGQVAEAEAWSTKSQAKQIVWAFGVQKGIIPSDARRVWVTAHDEKVCKHCGPLDRKRVEVGQTFDTTLGKAWTPPLHVNCRCDVVLEYVTAPKLAVAKRLRKHTRESFAQAYEPGVHQIPTRHLTKLVDGQPRNPQKVQAVQNSIKREGIKTPLSVNRFESGAYLMNGHHRLQAAKNLRLRKVPVEVQDGPYVSKAYDKDEPRDEHGRWARQPSRNPRRPHPRPYAPAPERSAIQEQIQRQLEEAQRAEAQRLAEQVKEAPAEAPEKLESNKLAPMKLGKLEKLPSSKLGSMKLESTKLEKPKLSAEAQKLAAQKLGQPKLALEPTKLSAAQKLSIKRVIYALGAAPTPVEDLSIEDKSPWVVADFPIAVIIPQYEIGVRDVVISEKDNGISMGDRVFGGEDVLYERIAEHWEKMKEQYLDDLKMQAEKGKAGGGVYDYYEDAAGMWEVDRASMRQALDEAVAKTPSKDSTHVMLQNHHDDEDKTLVPASHLIVAFHLDDWVEDHKPNVVVLRHINTETHELRGRNWKVPGKYRHVADSRDIPNLQGSDLPMEAYYVEPTD